ncbi:ABC transporter substrate-binding protein [Lautropia mirabilis]|uniref:ABC transporter substrate-binding protein n=1 Tax=Lautropia mirabilis TaxID=47671 RepID=UPI0028D11268|nr:ABC transporter substrate-binding protein [Lautropia mirabilis]
MRPAKLLVLLAAGIFSTQALAERTIVDQLDRSVTLPDRIERAVILQHQTVNIANQLDAMKQVVGVLSNWKKQLGADYVRLAPELPKLGTPGDLTTVNIESLLALKPDVVFVTNYAPPEMIKSITDTGLPVVAISLRTGSEKEQAKLNPTLENEDQSYNDGLKQGIRIIADVFGKQKQGEELIKATFANRPLVEKRLKDVKPQERVRTYMANPDLTTYGSGKYTGLMMEHAGAYNVAAATIKGFKQVSLENVLEWNPQVIFVQNRFPQVVPAIQNDPGWANVDAVKGKRVFLMPQYAKAWGYPMPEAVALGELWMARKLYPKRFADIDLDRMVNDYYLKFYRVPYQPDSADQ